MPTFSADDARLAGMHGYEPAKEPLEGRLRTAEQQNKAMGVGAYKSPAGDYPPPAETSVRKSDVPLGRRQSRIARYVAVRYQNARRRSPVHAIV